MSPDGFSAGVEPGGLYRTEDIQLLLCYVLNSQREPMPRQMLMDVVVGNEMANFFETTEALEKLIGAGSVIEGDDPESLLTLGQNGQIAVETLLDHLPFTLRERSVKLAIRAMARRRNEQDCTFDIKDLEHGCIITCAIRDPEAPLMSLSLKVADHSQAEFIKEQFLNYTNLTYRSILSILTGRAEVREEDGDTVVHVI